MISTQRRLPWFASKALYRIASAHAACNQNDVLVSASPASLGANTLGTVAHMFQPHTQVTDVVPRNPQTNGVVAWEAASCRGIAAAVASHDRVGNCLALGTDDQHTRAKWAARTLRAEP